MKNILEAVNKGIRQSFIIDDDEIEGLDSLYSEPIFQHEKPKIINGKKRFEQTIKLKKIEFNNIVKEIKHSVTKENLDKLVEIYKTYGIQYKVTDKDFKFFINCIIYFDKQANLNWIDTSKITQMDSLFARSMFNGDISEWDVSNVWDFNHMFAHSSFNGDLSKWDVSSATDMSGMFQGSWLDKNCLKDWNVSNVKNMYAMFQNSFFNGDISKWDVSNVKWMSEMFTESQFNQDISGWDVSSVTNMSRMFYKSKFNCDISHWQPLELVNVNEMFVDSEYSGSIENWNCPKLKYFTRAFDNSNVKYERLLNKKD